MKKETKGLLKKGAIPAAIFGVLGAFIIYLGSAGGSMVLNSLVSLSGPSYSSIISSLASSLIIPIVSAAVGAFSGLSMYFFLPEKVGKDRTKKARVAGAGSGLVASFVSTALYIVFYSLGVVFSLVTFGTFMGARGGRSILFFILALIFLGLVGVIGLTFGAVGGVVGGTLADWMK